VRIRTIRFWKLGESSTPAVRADPAPILASMSPKKVAPKVKLVAVIGPVAAVLRPGPTAAK
jgi:hypothetical protein